MGTHPDVVEMQERYARAASRPPAIALDGLILLTGLYAAISPWVVHFSGSRDITVSNLIVGITMGLIGLGLGYAPERMFRLGWVAAPLGIWLIISPWVVTATHGARAGIVWNNCWVGAVGCALGLAAAGFTVALSVRRPSARKGMGRPS